MKQFFSKYAPQTLGILILLAAALAVGAFTAPTQAPPGGNVEAPINVGSGNQTKTGGMLQLYNLWVNNALGVTGGATFGGSVGIGTASPEAMLQLEKSGDTNLTFKTKDISHSFTFNYTGGQQTWRVPGGVTSVSVDVRGAEGGIGWESYETYRPPAGRGARVLATLSVTPGEILYIYVGGAGGAASASGPGAGGWNGGAAGGNEIENGGCCPGNFGGGGGGASDIRQGGNTLSNRVVVAGGGGGAGGWAGSSAMPGGIGGHGGKNGDAGGAPASGVCFPKPGGGGGGTQSSGGSAGTDAFGGGGGGGGGGGYYGGGGGGGSSYHAPDPAGGWLGTGGNGGTGDAGRACAGAGGGGGSSFCGAGCSGASYTTGYQSGNGQIIISYTSVSIPWTIGGDQSDNGNFKISNSTDLGNIDRMLIDNEGNLKAISFGSLSDLRLKKNIVPLSVLGSVLEKLNNLRGIYFDWDETDQEFGLADSGRQIGLIAQEVQKEFPELVSSWGGDSDYKTVDYERFSAVLLEGIKELKEAVDELRIENEALKQRIKHLEEILR